MKICEYIPCSKEFEPKNPKGRFCSAKCRVYAGRGLSEPKVAAVKPLLPISKPSAKKKVEPVVRPVKAEPQLVVPDPPQPRPVVTGGWRPPSTPEEVEAARLALERVRAENAARMLVKPGRIDVPNCGAGVVSGLLSKLPAHRRGDLSKPQ